MAPAKKAKSPQSEGRRARGKGGHRLAEAFATVEQFPALDESRRRVERIVSQPGPSVDEITEAIESDAGLAIAVLRAAGSVNGGPVRLTATPDAVEILTPD